MREENRTKQEEELCPNCNHDDVEREFGTFVTRCYNCGYNSQMPC